jgi:hypothetical protein
MKIIAAVVLSVLAHYSSSVAIAETSIRGEKGEWKVYWHGTGIGHGNTVNMPRACPLVGDAIEAARNGTLSDFAELFKDVGSNNPPAYVTGCFNELRSVSHQFVYLIAAEAIYVGPDSMDSNVLSAISVVPAIRAQGGSNYSDMPKLQPRILFARQTGGGWQLVANNSDVEVTDYLAGIALEYVYKSDTNMFASDGDARAAQRQIEIANQSRMLTELIERGAPVEQINALRERFKVQSQVAAENGWEAWKKNYQAQILAAPLSVDISQEGGRDFNSPIAAFRAYRHALFSGDAKVLLENADESGKAWLRRQLNVDEHSPKSTYYLFPRVTRFVVLLTATHIFDGKEYTLVLCRAQEADEPKRGRVFFSVDIFRKEGSRYVFTRDLDFLSPFGAVTEAARANGANFLPYPKFYEKVKPSDFPAHFYTIE